MQGRELESVELSELEKAMEKHFQPKKLLLSKRYKMMSLAQHEGQSLHDFYAEIRKAANECGFEKIKDFRDAMTKMVFIGGLLCVETRKRLLEKEELSSKDALEAAESFQMVGKSAPKLSHPDVVKPGVCRVTAGLRKNNSSGPKSMSSSMSKRGDDRRDAKKRGHSPRSRSGLGKGVLRSPSRPQSCWTCGGSGHLKANCRFKNVKCLRCQRPGHMAKVCTGVSPKASRPVNWCEPESADSEDVFSGVDVQDANVDVNVNVLSHVRRRVRNADSERCNRSGDGLPREVARKQQSVDRKGRVKVRQDNVITPAIKGNSPKIRPHFVQ